MRKLLVIAAAAAVSCASAAGCGGGSETETVPFKATDANQFNDMSKVMIENMKKKPGERYKTAKPADQGDAGKAPAK